MGFIVIPGSKNVEHIKDNLDILDFELTKEEMNEILKLKFFIEENLEKMVTKK